MASLFNSSSDYTTLNGRGKEVEEAVMYFYCKFHNFPGGTNENSEKHPCGNLWAKI
jgi:hypothetical protein